MNYKEKLRNMITQEKIAYSADEIKALVKTCEKYNKALERARKICDSEFEPNDKSILCSIIFPELAESKDERIRKTIYGWIYTQPSEFFDNGFSKEEMLAWLEKQGKEEYALTSFKDEDICKFMQYIEKQAKAYEFNLPYGGYDIYAFTKDILYWLKKQCDNKESDPDKWEVTTGLYKCTKRMFDGTPEDKLLFETGNLYRCVSKHDIAEFESSYGHSVFLIDPVVRKHFIKVENTTDKQSDNIPTLTDKDYDKLFINCKHEKD